MEIRAAIDFINRVARARSVLFLDFDGVVARNIAGLSAFNRIVPYRVACLSEIVARTGCDVVVSSTWRRDPHTGHGFPASELEGYLRERAYTGRILDITPTHETVSFVEDIARVRGGEILAWLRAQRLKPSAVVVLDDVALEGPMAPYQVRTVEEVGLTVGDVERAVWLFRRQPKGRPPWLLEASRHARSPRAPRELEPMEPMEQMSFFALLGLGER